MIISKAAANLKKVGDANLTHTIITTRINAHEKNRIEFQENHRLLCTLRDSVDGKHEYFAKNVYSTSEEEYLLSLIEFIHSLKKN